MVVSETSVSLKKVFYCLYENCIDYFVFKSACDLNRDLLGVRGDIDLFVSPEHVQPAKNILLKNGFFPCWRNGFEYWVTVLDSGLFVFDIYSGEIRFGPKPLKRFAIGLKTSECSTELQWLQEIPVRVLVGWDYFLLNVLFRSCSSWVVKKETCELQNYYDRLRKSDFPRSGVPFLSSSELDLKSIVEDFSIDSAYPIF